MCVSVCVQQINGNVKKKCYNKYNFCFLKILSIKKKSYRIYAAAMIVEKEEATNLVSFIQYIKDKL